MNNPVVFTNNHDHHWDSFFRVGFDLNGADDALWTMRDDGRVHQEKGDAIHYAIFHYSHFSH